MTKSLTLLQTRERMLVGRRFLSLRPRVAALGALGNALFLVRSSAPQLQKLVLAVALLSMVSGFFVEGALLRRYALSERWLFASLALTLLGLSLGALLSGGLSSPLLPLLLTPVVVGFAAFAKGKQSLWLFGIALGALLLLSALAPLPLFPVLPSPAATRMLLVSALVSLLLLWIGVSGLVDAHARIATELDRMRSDLLKEAERRATNMEHLGAKVAHEVKNPLAAVRGLVQLVERTELEAREKKRLAVVISEVDRALDILKGYLSFARPLRDLALAEVDLRALLDDVAGVLEGRANEQKVRLIVVGESQRALVDRGRLRDALLNLGLNSIAAMPNGGTLEFAVTSTEDAVRLAVRDTGSGMSPERLTKLGEPFASEAEGGTGLGVLVARAAATQHGGRLHFESSVGQGMLATLELPSRLPTRLEAERS
jgi:signal transduction histidine kinase